MRAKGVEWKNIDIGLMVSSPCISLSMEWILDRRSVPHIDFYSFTKYGQPWISKPWLEPMLPARWVMLCFGFVDFLEVVPLP